MLTVFLDANIYLHAKPVAEIPWRDLLGEDVLILVPRITVQELDEQKDRNGKQGIRDRARSVLREIETWATPTELRRGVVIQYLHEEPDELPKGLRRSRNDDLLIATILHYGSVNANGALLLITNDTGARLTARHFGVSARALPEGYELPQAPDAVQEENRRLRQQLHELQSAAPQLSITINDETKNVRVRPLGATPKPTSSAEVDRVAAEARAALPVVAATETSTDAESPVQIENGKLRLSVAALDLMNLDAISAKEYARYATDCAEFEEAHRRYQWDCHEVRVIRSRTVKLDIVIRNSGGKPADDITLIVKVPDHLGISETAPTAGAPPAKPRPPRTAGQILGLRRTDGVGISDIAAPYLMNLPNFIAKDQDGPQVDGPRAKWWVREVKHGFARSLGTVYVTSASDLKPFTIEVEIHAANVVKAVGARILVKPITRTTDIDG